MAEDISEFQPWLGSGRTATVVGIIFMAVFMLLSIVLVGLGVIGVRSWEAPFRLMAIIAGAIGGVLSGGLLLLSLRWLSYAGSRYRLDAAGISRLGVNETEFLLWEEIEHVETRFWRLELKGAGGANSMLVSYAVDSFPDLVDQILERSTNLRLPSPPAEFAPSRYVVLFSKKLPAVGVILAATLAWLGGWQVMLFAVVLTIASAASGIGQGTVHLERSGLRTPQLFKGTQFIAWSDLVKVRVLHDYHGYLLAVVEHRDGDRTTLPLVRAGVVQLVASIRRASEQAGHGV